MKGERGLAAKKGGLGRGFDSLFLDNSSDAQTEGGSVSLPIGQIRLQWALPPVKGVVQTSDDARQWQTVAALKGTADNNTAEVVSMDAQARYVRLLLQEAGPAGRYALREMEVLSKWQKQYVPHATPAVKDGRQMLSGGQWRLLGTVRLRRLDTGHGAGHRTGFLLEHRRRA